MYAPSKSVEPDRQGSTRELLISSGLLEDSSYGTIILVFRAFFRFFLQYSRLKIEIIVKLSIYFLSQEEERINLLTSFWLIENVIKRKVIKI